MAKSRKERKAATAQFMLDQWCLLKECFEHTEIPKEAWKMYCQKYYNPNKFVEDQIYRQRFLLFKKEVTDLIEKILQEIINESKRS